MDNIRFLIQSPGAPLEAAKSNKPPQSASTSTASSIQAVQSGSGVKWVVTIIVLVAAAVAGAWYMGYLDKFLK